MSGAFDLASMQSAALPFRLHCAELLCAACCCECCCCCRWVRGSLGASAPWSARRVPPTAHCTAYYPLHSLFTTHCGLLTRHTAYSLLFTSLLPTSLLFTSLLPTSLLPTQRTPTTM